MIIRKDRFDVHHFFVIAAVFASTVPRAIFVGVAGWEIKTHMFGPSTGQGERFRRTRGWLYSALAWLVSGVQ